LNAIRAPGCGGVRAVGTTRFGFLERTGRFHIRTSECLARQYAGGPRIRSFEQKLALRLEIVIEHQPTRLLALFVDRHREVHERQAAASAWRRTFLEPGSIMFSTRSPAAIVPAASEHVMFA
jgi:hypothetical protein